MSEAGTTKRPKRRRRWLLALLVPLALVIAAVGVYLHLTDPVRVRAQAQQYLQKFFNGRVEVGSATWSWFGGVQLDDVKLFGLNKGPDPDGIVRTPAPVFLCPRIELAHDPFSVLWGKWRIRSVVAREPLCAVVRDLADHQTNLAGLLVDFDTLNLGSDSLSLPTVELQRARFTVARKTADKTERIEDLMLTVRGRAAHPASPLYDISWQEHGGEGRAGHARLDLARGTVSSVEGGLPWMSIESVMFAVDAHYDGAGSWCDLLGLNGTVRAEDFAFGGGTQGRQSATIVLQDAAISIPISEAEKALPYDQRYLRFEQVQGQVKVTRDGIEADFEGVFHGSACKVAAQLSSELEQIETLEDVAFEAHFQVNGLTLPLWGSEAPPAEARFVQNWERLERFYRDFEPAGLVDLEGRIRKQAGLEAPVQLQHGVLSARGCSMVCRFFPYPLEKVTGRIEQTPMGLFLREVQGRRDEARVRLDGWFEEARLHVPAELTICGQNVPLDQTLYHCLGPRTRELWDQFAPEGVVDLDVQLRRLRGTRENLPKFESTVTLACEDLTARYRHFPYPLEHISGMVRRDEHGIEIIDLVSKRGDTRITAEGGAQFDRGDLTDLDLTLNAWALPLDADLFEALPTASAEVVQRFDPRGTCDLTTRVFFDRDAGRVRHTSQVKLNQVRLKHERVPVEVGQVVGTLRLAGDTVGISDASGTCAGALLSLDGTVRLPAATGTAAEEDAATAGASLRGRILELELSESLRAALPERVRNTLADWKIGGKLDVDWSLDLDAAAGPEGLTFEALATANGVSVQHPHFPIPFEQVRGSVTLDETGPRAVRVEGNYGVAQLELELDTPRASDWTTGDFKLAATGVSLDDSLRAVLPARLQQAWDGLGPEGKIDLRLERLSYRDASTESAAQQVPRLWSVAGDVTLHDVSLRQVAESEHLNGTVTGSGQLIDREGGTHLAGDFNLTSCDLYQRHLENLIATWSFLDVPRRGGCFALKELVAELYGGSLTAELELMLEPEDTTYVCSATAQGMQMEPFLNAAMSAAPLDRQPVEVSGEADVRLYLSGSLKDVTTRRGGGRIEVADGRFCRLPIMVAILHVINLTLPEDDVFDEGAAEFFIVGDRMELKDLQLWSEALAFAGSGSMALSDKHLNLELVSVNPRQRTRIPVLSDLVEGASGGLMKINVVGPLWQPAVTAKTLPGIDAELRALFQPKQPPIVPGQPADEPEPAPGPKW